MKTWLLPWSVVLLPLWNRRDADGPVHRKWQNPVLRAWSRIQLCVICLMMIHLISRKANFVVSGKINQHLSYFPASDGSSCVCPQAAILAHLCCWFAIRHDTSARSRGGSLKHEDASVTLVDSVFSAGAWKFTNGTVTFQRTLYFNNSQRTLYFYRFNLRQVRKVRIHIWFLHRGLFSLPFLPLRWAKNAQPQQSFTTLTDWTLHWLMAHPFHWS